jgi:hypothetical protein
VIDISTQQRLTSWELSRRAITGIGDSIPVVFRLADAVEMVRLIHGGANVGAGEIVDCNAMFILVELSDSRQPVPVAAARRAAEEVHGRRK